MAKKIDLEERLIDFSVKVLRLADKIPYTYAGRHLGAQLVRLGTSPALNYEEAQGADSKADFQQKMKICLKELREARICLKIILRKPLLVDNEINDVIRECNDLVAIFSSGLKTIKRK